MASENHSVVGIDLGTTESRIAVCKNGKVQIIPDHFAKGQLCTPSYVSFVGSRIFLGGYAKREMGRNPKNTVFDVKRLVGRQKDGSLPRNNRFHWPFRVSLTTDKAQILVDRGIKNQTYYPEDIMYIVLERMMKNAKISLGHNVTHAVMTVPGYFKETQKEQTTSEIAQMANIINLHVISNCTAAAIAYCYKKNVKDVENVLVYDMGTYAFEVSLLDVKDLNPKVVCSESDLNLGGRNLDGLLMKHCLEVIRQKRRLDLKGDPEARWKLLPACEEAKKTLSLKNEAFIQANKLSQNYEFKCKISLQQFEEMCTDTFNATLSVVSRALRKAKIERGQIQHVILVGGSTRIPKLREMVKDYFQLKELDRCIEPEEAVVYGAAVLGDVLNKGIQIKGEGFLTPGKEAISFPRGGKHDENKSTQQHQDNTLGKKGSEAVKDKPKVDRETSTSEEAKAVEDVQEKVNKRVSPEHVTRPEPDMYQYRFTADMSGHKLHCDVISERRKLEETRRDEGPVTSEEEPAISDTSQSDEVKSESDNKDEPIAAGPAVGIDLGTTCSCIAVWKDNTASIIFNDHGNRVTPSYVSFTELERLVGDAAKKEILVAPENTVFDAKRMIGRTYDDPDIQKDIRSCWSFPVVNRDGKPLVLVNYQGERKPFYPEQISSMVLANLKESAETHLRMKVTNAVVTVPAYFNDAQRQATKDAGKIAGLNVLQIINEPTAAAIAYGLTNHAGKDTNVLVYDLGGGTFDVTVLTINGLTFKVRSTCGDTHLGGRDFDNRMVDFYVDMLKRTHNRDIRGNHKAMQRLRVACEDAKQVISNKTVTDVIVDNIIDGVDLKHRLSKSRFDDMCGDLFRRTMDIVSQALSEAKVDKSEVDDVVLVGGSTRIPKIQEIVKTFFGIRELCMNVNPEEAVATGAAVQAAVLHGDDEGHRINEVKLKDVIPMSLGIQVEGSRMVPMLKKNTTIPCKNTRSFTTTQDGQDVFIIRIYEGESNLIEKNNYLDSIALSGLPAQPEGALKLKVTFEVDENGILHVTAEEAGRFGQINTITIGNARQRFSQQELEQMKREEELLKEEEKKRKAQFFAKEELEKYALFVQKELEGMSPGNVKSKAQIINLTHTCKTVLQWIDDSPAASTEMLEKKLNVLKKDWASVKGNVMSQHN